MSRAVRWGVAVGLSIAAFALGWWVCVGLLHRDEGISLAIASAALAIVIAITGWWAGLERHGKEPGADGGGEARKVNQRVRAGRDAYVAGRDFSINPPKDK
jgi:hypothetical protein